MTAIAATYAPAGDQGHGGHEGPAHEPHEVPPIIIFGDEPDHPAAPEPAVKQVRDAIGRVVEFYDWGWGQWLVTSSLAAYAVANLAVGRPLSVWFWVLAAATLLFHALAKRPPYLRVTDWGLAFPTGSFPEVHWDEIRFARQREHGIELHLKGGERIEIRYASMRFRDGGKLWQLVRRRVEVAE